MKVKYFLPLIIVLLVVSCAPSLSMISVAPPELDYEIQESSFLFTIKCKNSKAKLLYTLDGSDPTEKGIRYQGPFEASFDTEVLKCCVVLGDLKSDVYTLELNMPRLDPPSISFNKTTCMATITPYTPIYGVTYYYRIGDEGEFMEYTEPVLVYFGETLYAKAEKEGSVPSPVVVEMNVDPNAPKAEKPVLSVLFSGTYTETTPSVKVTLVDISSTDEEDIYYTLNGSTPTSGSIKYNGPVAIFGSATLKVKAIPKSTTGINPSEEVSMSYNSGYSGTGSITATSLNLPSWLPVVVDWENHTSHNENANENYKYTIRISDELYFVTESGKLLTMDTLAHSMDSSITQIKIKGVEEDLGNGNAKYTVSAVFGRESEKSLLTIKKNGEDLYLERYF